jgi:hypothetical protein
MNLDQPTRALLDLIETDRARRCAQLLDEANARAAAGLSQAHAEARARMRQAFAEQRQRRHDRLAEAQARLATQRRLHAQRRHAALLQRAWQQLPTALLARWQQADGRAAWVAHVLASAHTRLPRGAWRIVHAPDWPPAEQQAHVPALADAAGSPPHFEADAAIRAGLKVVANGNVIDGTQEGLLADRAAIEALLLRELEQRA